MKTLMIGGNSRNVGKTGLAVSILEATRELQWTAVKVTQFGHGICSNSGEPCDCAVNDPLCPYEILQEDGLKPTTDTARMLHAGARDVFWVRVAMGQMQQVIPAVQQHLEGREYVLFESNSIMAYLNSDLYLSVLDLDNEDCKESACRFSHRADAFVLPAARKSIPEWPGFDASLLERKPLFAVQPPSFCSSDLIGFAISRIQSENVATIT